MDLPTERRAVTAATIGAACLFAPLFAPLVLGRVFSIGDLGDFHLPLRHLYQSALLNGDSILWTNRMFSGFYLHAEGQIGALHPLHLVLYRFLPLTVAFNLELIASYIFSFAGMTLLLRRLDFRTSSALTGAIAFSFSGFNLLHLLHMNAIAIIAHVPWLVLALNGALWGDRRRQSRSLTSLSALTGSMVLLGYPQYLWMAALICAIYVLVNALKTSARRVAMVCAAAVAGIMVGGVQLIPTIDLLSHSIRQEVPSGFSLTYSLHPLNLAQFVSPYLLSNRVYATPRELFVHEFGVYNGVFCTVAATWVLFRWRDLPYRTTAAFGLTLVAVGLLLALGRYGPIYETVASLPLVGKFRAPARHIALVHSGLALLAAVAFDDLQRASSQSKKDAGAPWIWLPLVLSVGVAFGVSAWIANGLAFEGQSVDSAGAFISIILVLVITLGVTDAWKGSKNAVIALPLFLALDLALWGYGYVVPGGVKTVAEVAAQAEAPPTDAGASLHAPETLRPDWLLLSNFRIARPYVGLHPFRQLQLTSASELQVSGVEWLQTPDGWHKLADPLPRVRIVPERLITNDAVSALSLIDIRRVAIVDGELPLLDPRATAELVADSSGKIIADVFSGGYALLTTTEAYHSGWKASTDDGRELGTIRVYGDYLGVLVASGRYRLTLSFKPRSIVLGAYLSLGGLALTAGLAIAARGVGRRASHS